jgi:hypothetical protein
LQGVTRQIPVLRSFLDLVPESTFYWKLACQRAP